MMTQPAPLGLTPSFGFGDRIGLATPGHVAAMQTYGDGLAPIYPQQSIREMTRTGRDAATVMRDALNGMAAAGWTGPTGADADHLRTREDVDCTMAAGFVFFTIDPSDHVDEEADGYDEETVNARFAEVAGEIEWVDRYAGKTVSLLTGATIDFTRSDVLRAAVKYGRALNAAIDLARYIRTKSAELGQDCEIELSVDETDQPTSLAEHYIVADQCGQRGVPITSLAPRFMGRFEKGLDYIGDKEELERSLADHAAIARMLGPYKLSLHSGSDKLSMYAAFARATQGRFHVKTAGTSYLEALRVAAIEDAPLFRRLCAFARGRYDTDKATYHVHATLDMAPEPADVDTDKELERLYLECWDDVPQGRGFRAPGRQIMHCTYGSVLTHPEHGPALRQCLEDHADTYAEVLHEHFGRHLQALKAGM